MRRRGIGPPGAIGTRSAGSADRTYGDPVPLPGGQCGTHLVGDVRWTDEQQVKIGISAAGAQSAVNHDGG